MTHCRFCWENPRSFWIEGSATFTIAMSSTIMNWTTLSRPSASHFFRSEVTISWSPSVLRCLMACTLGESACNLAVSTLKKQVDSSNQQVDALHSLHAQGL